MSAIHIVCLLAAATARRIPENYNPALISPPVDFPRLSLTQHTLESRGTGVNNRNGEDVQEQPRHIAEHVDGNIHRTHNTKPVRHLEHLDLFEKHRSGNDRPHNLKIPQEKPMEIDTHLPKSDRNLPKIEDDEKIIQRKPSHHDSNVSVGSDDKNKQHNNVQKLHSNATDNQETSIMKIAPTNPNYTRDNVGNKFNENPAKTNINRSSAQDSKTNQVTKVPFEESSIESVFKGNVSDDKWLWNSTTTVSPIGPDVDDRSAFDGGECPTGQVRIQGSTKCVEKDED